MQYFLPCTVGRLGRLLRQPSKYSPLVDNASAWLLPDSCGPTLTAFLSNVGSPGQPPAPQRFLAGPPPAVCPYLMLTLQWLKQAFSNDIAIEWQRAGSEGVRHVRKTGGNAGDHPGLTARTAVRGQVETGMLSTVRSAR